MIIESPIFIFKSILSWWVELRHYGNIDHRISLFILVSTTILENYLRECIDNIKRIKR